MADKTIADRVIEDVENLMQHEANQRAAVAKDFFASPPDDQVDPEPLRPPAPPGRPPRRRPLQRALLSIVKALESMPPRERWATVRWLADRYHAHEPPESAPAVREDVEQSIVPLRDD